METICDVLIYSRRIYDNSAWQFILFARNYHRGVFILIDYWWKFGDIESARNYALTDLIDTQFRRDQCLFVFEPDNMHLEETVK